MSLNYYLMSLNYYTQEGLFGLRTCVVQLGDMDQTGMCVLACRPYTYSGRGAAVWFLGSTIHRSLAYREDLTPPLQPVWKVSLFYLQADIIAALQPGV